jgi:hypothetical protein
MIPARVVTRAAVSEEGKTRQALVYVVLANFSDETFTLPRYTAIGVADEVFEDLINQINKSDKSDVEFSERSNRKRRDEALYDRLIAGKLDHLRKISRSLSLCLESSRISSMTKALMILRRRTSFNTILCWRTQNQLAAPLIGRPMRCEGK